MLSLGEEAQRKQIQCKNIILAESSCMTEASFVRLSELEDCQAPCLCAKDFEVTDPRRSVGMAAYDIVNPHSGKRVSL
jgi:hypothetical protein